ncbi:MAG: Uma2 family endonuclease [Chloroflexota bacterium]|nr:Uma2 family endonuclease [Chloroflexota bacterium]
MVGSGDKEYPYAARFGLKEVPPLESGDRLTRQEFERRYEAMPNLKKAELIKGMVYVPSPVLVSHGEPHSLIIWWLGSYRIATPGVRVYDNVTVRLDVENEPQPDALLRLEEALGGTSKIDDDGYVSGLPEMIVEIAGTSAAYDLHDKKEVYQHYDVKEYLVWQVYDQRFDWWRLVDGEYVAIEPDEEGVIRSQVFPGLWLAAESLLSGDLATVARSLQEGLASEQHATFVETLQREAEPGDH